MHFSSFHFWVENFYSKGMFIRRVLSLHLRIISHLLYDLEPSLSSRWLGSSPMDHMWWSCANLDSSRRLQKESVTIIVEFYMTLSLTQHQFEVLRLPMYDKNMTRFKICNEMPVIRPYTLANPVKFKVQRKQGTFTLISIFLWTLTMLNWCWRYSLHFIYIGTHTVTYNCIWPDQALFKIRIESFFFHLHTDHIKYRYANSNANQKRPQ